MIYQNPKSLYDLTGKGYETFWHTRKKYRVCKGSRASKKSTTTALWIIFNMMKHPEANTLVVRKVYRTMKDSCFMQLKWAVNQLGVSNQWDFKESPLEATYKPTGQKIYFRGLDDPQKITSITVEIGVLCWVWIEEAYEIMSEADFDMLDESIRGEMPEDLFKQITLTFNPWNEHHWIKGRFFDTPDDDTFSITTNYLCNEWLDDADRKMFNRMKERNPRRYQVAGLGNWGVVEGLVYDNWSEEEFSLQSIQTTYRDLQDGFGLDFGYTNDPTAGFIGFISREAKTIWVWDELYEKGLSNRMIYSRLSSMGYGKDQFTGDSAEPKSIDELKGLGLRIRGAAKGKDSVNNGIQFIQDYRIVVHPRCVNFLTEISNYTWDKDKFNNKLNSPIDDFNHLMDAMRYGLEKFITCSTPQIRTFKGGF